MNSVSVNSLNNFKRPRLVKVNNKSRQSLCNIKRVQKISLQYKNQSKVYSQNRDYQDLPFCQQNFYEAKVQGEAALQKDSNNWIINLQIQDGLSSVLQIFIGDQECQAMLNSLHKRPVQRPVFYDVFRETIDQIGFKVVRVCVNDLVSNTFHARVYVSQQSHTLPHALQPPSINPTQEQQSAQTQKQQVQQQLQQDGSIQDSTNSSNNTQNKNNGNGNGEGSNNLNSGLVNGTNLCSNGSGGSYEVEYSFDSRPSDAINVAIRSGAPVYVSKEIAKKMGRPQTIDVAAHQLVNVQNVHYKDYGLQELIKSCEEEIKKSQDPVIFDKLRKEIAIAEERYEDAIQIQNEIERTLQCSREMSLIVSLEAAVRGLRFEDAVKYRDELQALRSNMSQINLSNS